MIGTVIFVAGLVTFIGISASSDRTSQMISERVSTPDAGGSYTSIDPVMFSSDTFTIESTGGISIQDPTKAGAGILPITITSSTGDALYLNLIESTTTPGMFTTQNEILFTAGNTTQSSPANPTTSPTPALHVAVGTNAISLSYNSLTATANIILPSTPTIGTPASFQLVYNTACADADKDGICDSWETQPYQSARTGHTGLFINVGEGYNYRYPTSGSTCPPAIDDSSGNPPQNPADPTTMPSCSDTTKKDIFVEIDYMSGHKPNRQALTDVINAFANAPVVCVPGKTLSQCHGIRLHIQLDEDLGFHIDQIPLDASGLVPTDPNAHDANGNGVGFVQLKRAHFGTLSERIAAECTDPNNASTCQIGFIDDKRQVFHYAMFIHDLQDTPTSTGWADIFGNDMVISLGEYAGHTGSTAQQEGVFMHELGHNLGLRHGGDTDYPNCKPNYISVMNYAYQFPNLVPSRPLDFSRSVLPTLDEVGGLSESTGIDQSTPPGLQIVYGPVTGTAPFTSYVVSQPLSSTNNTIDWNRDNTQVAGELVHLPIHELGIPDCTDSTLQKLTGFNDWASINLVFRTSATSSD